MQVIGYLNLSRQGGTGIPERSEDMPGKSLTGSTSQRSRKPP